MVHNKSNSNISSIPRRHFFCRRPIFSHGRWDVLAIAITNLRIYGEKKVSNRAFNTTSGPNQIYLMAWWCQDIDIVSSRQNKSNYRFVYRSVCLSIQSKWNCSRLIELICGLSQKKEQRFKQLKAEIDKLNWNWITLSICNITQSSARHLIRRRRLSRYACVTIWISVTCTVSCRIPSLARAKTTITATGTCRL